VSVLDSIQRSADFLSRKGVDSPRLQAELLLAHLLQLPRMQLYLNFQRLLTTVELDSYRELVKRRGQREPLQHIVGSVCFCGLELEVSPDALIPRPETELLAEYGWNFLAHLATTNSGPAHVLDFGTGTGCLAITLAVKNTAAQIYAVDVSTAALELARRNAVRHPVAERIHFLHGDGFLAVPKDTRFDLVISNPPYIPAAEIKTLQPEIRDHEPCSALDGGADGLEYYRRLATEAGAFLKPHGKAMLEFGDNQGEAIREIFERQKWVVEAIEPDYTQRARILIARSPKT
jgi:release factor glutamine methyltransferase